jgi:hypothetical protein
VKLITPRLTVADKVDYFRHFLQDRPSGKIDFRFVGLACNSAVDAGLYTFSFARTGAVVKARYTYTYHWDGHTPCDLAKEDRSLRGDFRRMCRHFSGFDSSFAAGVWSR